MRASFPYSHLGGLSTLIESSHLYLPYWFTPVSSLLVHTCIFLSGSLTNLSKTPTWNLLAFDIKVAKAVSFVQKVTVYICQYSVLSVHI